MKRILLATALAGIAFALALTVLHVSVAKNATNLDTVTVRGNDFARKFHCDVVITRESSYLVPGPYYGIYIKDAPSSYRGRTVIKEIHP
jgi:hypothetical protein